MTLPLGDGIFWLLVIAGPAIGAVLYWKLGEPASLAAPAAAVLPKPIAPNPLPVPTQRVGIPPTALAKIQEACGGLMKDGELDIRFELRSRRDCDQMLEEMKKMKEKLQHTKSVFDSAVAEIRVQVDTGRVTGLLGKDAAQTVQFVTAKNAELEGYETATRLIDKFLLELASAEVSVLHLPFYETADPPTSA